MELSAEQVAAILEGYGCDEEEINEIVQEVADGNYRKLELKMLSE